MEAKSLTFVGRPLPARPIWMQDPCACLVNFQTLDPASKDDIMALDQGDRLWLDGKFDGIHSRVTDLGEKLAAHAAAPCPDVKEHIGIYHRRSGDLNGNGAQSYKAVHPDTFRTGSQAVWKIGGLVMGLTVSSLGAGIG